jgi:hypothetical protein
MQCKLLPTDDQLKIHFRASSINEANLVKHELEDSGYSVILFKIKEHKRVGE